MIDEVLNAIHLQWEDVPEMEYGCYAYLQSMETLNWQRLHSKELIRWGAVVNVALC